MMVESATFHFVNIAQYSIYRIHCLHSRNSKSDSIFSLLRLLVKSTNILFEYQFKGMFGLSIFSYLFSELQDETIQNSYHKFSYIEARGIIKVNGWCLKVLLCSPLSESCSYHVEWQQSRVQKGGAHQDRQPRAGATCTPCGPSLRQGPYLWHGLRRHAPRQWSLHHICHTVKKKVS